MKRVLAFVLCIAMLLCVVPAVAAEDSEATEPTQATEPAEPTEPEEPEEPEEPAVVRPPRPTKENMPGISDSELKMEQLAWDTFTACQRTSGKTSFHGYCGNFVSHQLFNLGINRYLSTRHGKDHYDYYSQLEKTSGGYFPRGISTNEIHLTGALKYITGDGSKDVYNVLVGFDWTNTEAGNKYGHVVLIYAIIGGSLYFSESFDMYFKGRVYPEGSLIKSSIEEFVDYYDGWTRYEGIVVLGSKNYAEFCEQNNTNLMVQTRFDTVLRSQPCQVGKNKCQVLRNVAAGERLQASAVFKNGNEELFYRIADGEMEGYVAAGSVCVLQANAFNNTIDELNVPQIVPQGQDVDISGSVSGEYAKVRGVTVQLVDGENQVVQEQLWENYSNQCTLERINEKLDFGKLSPGFYTLKVIGDVKSPTADGGLLSARGLLGGCYFQVGGERFITRAMPRLQYQEEPDATGWMYQDGWYFYEDGQPKTGWFTWCGVQYYLDVTGRAATGWTTIGENLHYFSGTGAMVKNCKVSQGRTTYQLDSLGIATKVRR